MKWGILAYEGLWAQAGEGRGVCCSNYPLASDAEAAVERLFRSANIQGNPRPFSRPSKICWRRPKAPLIRL
jgi:hypothetical protein